MSVRIRRVLPEDVPCIAKAAQDSSVSIDPDFEVETVPPWVMAEEDILRIIRQRHDPEKGEAESKTWAVEVTETLTVQGPDGPEAEEVSWVCGGFSYEYLDDAYGVVFAVVHPSADVPLVHYCVAEFVRGKIKGGKRKRAEVAFRDAREARLEVVIPAWRRAGFKFRLVPGMFGETDGWVGTYGR